ncbi:hypothetical protein D3C87_2001370 [compost metagenome]
MLVAGTGRRRQYRLPVHIDDAVDATHQKCLHRTVVFRHDNGAAGARLQRPHTNSLGKVDDRQRLPAQVDDAAHEGMAMWH